MHAVLQLCVQCTLCAHYDLYMCIQHGASRLGLHGITHTACCIRGCARPTLH